MKKFTIPLLLFSSLVFTSCSSTNSSVTRSNVSEQNYINKQENNTVSVNQLENLDITSFFTRKANTEKVFDLLDNKGNKFGEVKELVLAPHTIENGRYIIETSMQEYPIENEEKLIIGNFYELSNSELKKVFTRDNLTGEQTFDDIVITNKQTEWRSKDGTKTFFISAINKTIKTPINSFDGCIEVTEINKDEKTITTYAPSLGMVEKKVFLAGKLYNKMKLQHLKLGVDWPTNNGDSKSTSGRNPVEENTDIKVKDKISKLQLMDYVDRVNALSLTNVEYNLFNRPGYQEVNGNGIYNFVSLTTAEDIFIVTDKDSYIKQVTWDSKELVNQEILLNLQALLQGLNKNIPMEEINTFLIGDTPIKDFDAFSVELIKSEDGFNLSIEPK